MLDIEFQYIANLSTNTHGFIPDAKNITYFVNAFNDRGFIPTSFKSISNSKPSNRLQLSSSNNEWVVRFLEDRIDIVKTLQSSTKLGGFNEFCDDVVDIWEKINQNNERKLNRIGTAYVCLLRTMSEEELEGIAGKVFKPIPNFEDSLAWHAEIVSRVVKNFLNKDETLNIVLDLKRIQGEFNENEGTIPFDKIQLTLHINTFIENTDYRFDNTNIKAFFDTLKALNTELLKSTIEYLS